MCVVVVGGRVGVGVGGVGVGVATGTGDGAGSGAVAGGITTVAAKDHESHEPTGDPAAGPPLLPYTSRGAA